MKRNRYVIFLFLLAGILTSCTKKVIYEVTDPPIIFSQEVNPTRGTLIKSMDGQTFGVRGYIYDKFWDSEAAITEPDAKWLDVKVQCETGGVCTYNPPQYWKQNKNYSFFAYSPHSSVCLDKGNKKMLALSEPTLAGVPSITYTMTQSDLGDYEHHYDVMCAHMLDVNETNTSVVDFSFKHCLFGIKMIIMNLTEKPLELKDYRLTIYDIKNTSVTIPLDGSVATYTPFKNGTGDPTPVSVDYVFVDGAKASPITIPSTLNNSAYDVTNEVLGGSHIMLIPQMGDQQGIKGRLYMTLGGNTEPEKDPVDKQPGYNLFYPNQNMEPGVLYVLGVSYAGNNSNVILVAAEQWEDVISDITFE